MAVTRAQPLSLAGLSFSLAAKDGIRSWQEEWAPSTPQDLEPFREFVPFGNWGIGSSYPTANPNQYDYSQGIDTEEWGVLKPLQKFNTSSALQGSYATVMRSIRTSVASVLYEWTTTGNLTGASSAVASTSTWSNPTNVSSLNSTYASVSTGVSSFVNSEYLKITNFGISGIAAGTVTGVEIEVYGYHTGNFRYGNISPFLRCYLVKAGTILTTTTEDQILPLGTPGSVHYGGPGSLFGTTLNNADVMSNTFGIALRVIDGGGTSDFTTYIDWARIKVYTSSGIARYLYVGTTYNSTLAGPIVMKYPLSDTSTTSKFTGTGTAFTAGTDARVTDIAVLRDFRTERNPTPTVTDVALVCFGSDLAIRQIDSVTYNTTDTYKAGAHTAYATLAKVLPTLTNTEVRVWRVGAQDPGTSETAGTFTTLQNAALQTTPSVDYTATATWTPATPYRVGSWMSDITGITRFGLGLAVAKPEGVYLFDTNSIPQLIFSTESQPSPLNGKGLISFGSQLIIPTVTDLFAIPAARGEAAIGPRSLQANSSPVYGYPTAVTSWGRYLFVAFYNGSDSWIVKMRRTTFERVSHPFVFYPLIKVPNYRVNCLAVADDGAANPTFYLCWPKPYSGGSTFGGDEIGYTVVDGPGTPQYQSGGEWFSTRFGTVGLVTRIEQISVLGMDCDANNYWTASIAWDGDIFGNTFTSLGTVTNSGRITEINLTPGSNDTGYIYQIKLSPTIANSYLCPKLISPGFQDQTGIVVEGQRQPRSVHRIKFICAASERPINSNGSRNSYTAKQLYDTWSSYIGTTSLATMIAPDAFGTGVTKSAIIESVSYVEDTRDADDPPVRMIQVGVRIIGE